MRYQIILTALLLIFTGLVAGAQPTILKTTGPAALFGGKISGNIIDDKGQFLEAVTVSLLKATDSSRIRETVTNKAGHFVFTELQDGKYLLLASSVGYNRFYSQQVELSGQSSRILPPMVLTGTSTSLAAVAVVGKRPPIEQKADRTIINVDASPSNAGSTAMDVLEKAPGVTLDKDDNISLKGKQGVTVMIDGKPTYLSATQLANYLKSLPASAIDALEIMTNPSAKYDAAGNSGIINIKTKKNKAKGFNGSVTLTHTQGVYPKPSGSINLNYRTGKFNFFLNAGYSHWEGFQDLDINRNYLDQSGKFITSIFTQHTNMKFTNPEMNLKVGADFYLSKRTTIGFVARGFRNTEDDRSQSTIFLKSPNQTIDSIVYSPSTNNGLWKNGALNLNFRHQFDSLGTEITADADYIKYKSGSNQYFDNITYDPSWNEKGETVLTGNLP